MNPFRRISLVLWVLLRSLPLITWGRLLMPAVFAGSWALLRAVGLEPPTAFVWSAVLAQAAHLYAVLPVTVARQRRAFGRAKGGLSWAMLGYLAVFALQIWMADPVVTQRVVSAACAVYVGITVLVLCGDRLVLDRFVPVRDESDVPLEFRYHLLRLYALTALLVLVVNEILLAAGTTLQMRVIVFSMLPIVLFYLFEIMLRLTAPLTDESAD